MRVVLLLTLLPLILLASPILDTAYDVVQPTEEEHLEIPECEMNEVWMDCASCEQKCKEAPPRCPRVCQPAGCHCPAHKGFKRNEAGQCVSTC